MERLVCEDSAERMLGILIVATLPEAARSRCLFWSWECSAAMKGALEDEEEEMGLCDECVLCVIWAYILCRTTGAFRVVDAASLNHDVARMSKSCGVRLNKPSALFEVVDY